MRTAIQKYVTFRVFCSLLILATWTSCSREKTPQFPDAPVILITVDTLRSDKLPAYGAKQIKTPHIDDLAKNGVLFSKVYAQAPLTLPSHATIFTGLQPYEHGVRANTGYKLLAHETLAQVFKNAGYRTAGVVSSMVLRKETGIAQGFDFLDDLLQGNNKEQTHSYAQRDGKESLEIAKTWLNKNKENAFFLWLHLYEPHMPYSAPEPFASQTDSPYLAEILYVDFLIGKLVDYLKTNGLYDKAIIIFASDHGEGLNDHGEWEHGLTLYREAVQVPLIFKLPNGSRSATEIETPVALSDLFPTLTQLTGISTDSLSLDGSNVFSSKFPSKRTIYTETIFPELHFGWHKQQSIIYEGFHYIQGGESRIFNLNNDFNEKINLTATQTIPSPVLKAFQPFEASNFSTSEISPEEKELLESLGYSGTLAADDSLKQLNEEEFLELFRKIGNCKKLINNLQYPEAEHLLTELLNQYPEMLDARNMLGTALSAQGKYILAEHVFSETLMKSARDLSAWIGFIQARLALGKTEGLNQMVQNTLKDDPIIGGKLLLPVLTQYKQWDEGKSIAEAILNKYPNHFDASFFLAQSYLEKNEYLSTLKYIDSILDHEDRIPDSKIWSKVFFIQADALAKLQRNEESEIAFRKSLEKNKLNPESQRALALLLFSQNRPKEAMQTLRNWLEAEPNKTNYLLAAEVLDLVGFKKEAQDLIKLGGEISSP